MKIKLKVKGHEYEVDVDLEEGEEGDMEKLLKDIERISLKIEGTQREVLEELIVMLAYEIAYVKTALGGVYEKDENNGKSWEFSHRKESESGGEGRG
jgi:hypothetical protein